MASVPFAFAGEDLAASEMAIVDCATCRAQAGMIILTGDQLRQLDLAMSGRSKMTTATALREAVIPPKTQVAVDVPVTITQTVDQMVARHEEERNEAQRYRLPLREEERVTYDLPKNKHYSQKPKKYGRLNLIIANDDSDMSRIYLGLNKANSIKHNDPTEAGRGRSDMEERQTRNSRIFGIKWLRKF